MSLLFDSFRIFFNLQEVRGGGFIKKILFNSCGLVSFETRKQIVSLERLRFNITFLMLYLVIFGRNKMVFSLGKRFLLEIILF